MTEDFTLRPMTLNELSAYYYPTIDHSTKRRIKLATQLKIHFSARVLERWFQNGNVLTDVNAKLTLQQIWMIVRQLGWPPMKQMSK